MTSEFAAIVLAGGRGSRLGGIDKAALTLGDRPLLDRAVAAVDGAADVVVVGDPVPTARSVRFVREQPRYAGPAAALLTGAANLADLPTVIVLAVDMPWVGGATVQRVRAAARGGGAVLVDPHGRRQLLLALDGRRLRAVSATFEKWAGLPMHRLLRSFELVEVPAHGREARDVDSPADLAALHDPDPGS